MYRRVAAALLLFGMLAPCAASARRDLPRPPQVLLLGADADDDAWGNGGRSRATHGRDGEVWRRERLLGTRPPVKTPPPPKSADVKISSVPPPPPPPIR
ncbi:hypothetical protein ABZP36_031895 [Zizania latifolia]